MSEATARFALPFILAGQAQQELFHNEALTRIDFGLAAAVEEGLRDAPPQAPEPGQCWLVGEGASGEWSGHQGAIAAWTQSGWRFLSPLPGMLVWRKDAGLWLHWTGSEWSGGELPATAIRIGGRQVVGERLAGVPSPSGGTIIDAEARAAVDQVIVALKTHGLID